MKNNLKTKLIALALCVMLIASCLPLTAFAEDAENIVTMTAGDVIAGFAPAGADCTSTDESVAWVDSNGNLNAMKSGTATVSVPGEDAATDYTVNVEDYSDGSEIVGRLKLLARFNDSMQFYDGHVYLLFTSYQDGVEITVPDLYAGYEISDEYYEDISEDISCGSNHTGTDADRYFTFNDRMNSVTLNRGEIVTIGMYRGFDLSVPQAALGSIQNSALWTELVKTGKTGVIETVFRLFDTGQLSADEMIAELKAVFEETGTDYNKLLDGVVEGGVCFNRELYNQKLEWDQYENVTYEMDITANQLKTMTMYLGGNLNKFSILKNSCATVALRAWNAAVGTRNGEPDAYYLTSGGEGIYAVIDAPKGVRDSMLNRLPGCYRNNAEGVEEPDAGYQDDTGWVYVSAPEKVAPVNYVYAEDSLRIDESKTNPAKLIAAAKTDQPFIYNKDEQDVEVKINTSPIDEATVINSIDFTANGSTITLNEAPEDGIWFRAAVNDPVEGEDYYVIGEDGVAVPSEYEDGVLCFLAEELPCTYQIVGSSDGSRNILRTVIAGEDVKADTEVYYKNGDEKVVINSVAEVKSGTVIYVKSTLAADEYDHILGDIELNGVSFCCDDAFDAEEGAYIVEMPAAYSKLTITYEEAVLKYQADSVIQLAVGEKLAVSDCAELLVGEDEVSFDDMEWQIVDNSDEALVVEGDTLTAVKEGNAVLWACAAENENIGLPFSVNVYDDPDSMAAITFDDSTEYNSLITAAFEDTEVLIPKSGYLVKKGSVLTVTAIPDMGQAILSLTANLRPVAPGETISVVGDTDIKLLLTDATVANMPREIRLNAKGDTYQLEPKVQYSGIFKLLPVYDPSITFKSSDEAVTVDESGMITVAGDVPEEGKLVVVTAIAGSSLKSVTASTRIILGNYRGAEIVGRMTVYARSINKGQLVAHGAVTFTTYEDVEFDASFYHYYKPNDKYNALMIDYEKNPGNYTSDPALYSDNELGLEDRESYFDIYSNGSGSAPQKISLKAGESFTVSNYGYDTANTITIQKALIDSDISSSKEAQELIRQMQLYIDGQEIDGEAAFDSLLATLIQINMISKATGQTPANGHSEGGMDFNRELFNQFRRPDLQTPNNYYTVEITADEFELMKAYLADPKNNYYSLFAKNCGTGAADIWNATLADKPELHLSANYTGLAVDPQSLNIELALLTAKQKIEGFDGEGGKDFYPRTVAYTDEVLDVMEKIDAIGEVGLTDDCKAKIDAAREAYDALSDSEKERVRNIDVLTDAEKAYADALLAAEKAEYAAYQMEQIAAAEALLNEDSDSTDQILVALTQVLIAATPYDDAKSLDENKAAVDAIMDQLRELLKKDRPILGDVDGDGEVNIIDATLIQRYLADIPLDFELDKKVADIDGDGEVSIIDATLIQRWLADLDPDENIGKPIR